MEISILIDNEFARLELLPEQRLMRLSWKGHVSGAPYRELLGSLLAAVEEHAVTMLLSDARRMGPVFFADQGWTEKEILPQLLEHGLLRIANIHSHEGLDVITVGRSKDDVPSTINLKSRCFDNLSMAMLWLLDNDEADVSTYMEQDRLDMLHSYEVLDTEAQASYDDIVAIASMITDSPIALISLVDERRQWFKARVGLAAPETPRDVSFCSHAIQNPEDLFVVTDAWDDPRFAKNPLVTGDPNIRFYAGAPLVNPDGFALGTLCVIDRKPREMDDAQLLALRALARMVVMQLEYRKLALDLKSAHTDLDSYVGDLKEHKQRLERLLTRHLSSERPRGGQSLAVIAKAIQGASGIERATA